MFIVIALVIIIAVMSAVLVIRSDRDRKKAEEAREQFRQLLLDVIKASEHQSELESIARKSIKKVARIRKQQVKDLKRELNDMMLLSDDDGPEDEEEDEKDDEEAADRRGKANIDLGYPDHRIAATALALQTRLSKIRKELDAVDGDMSASDRALLRELSDTSLDSIEKDLNEQQ
jgi:hypothetical protein